MNKQPNSPTNEYAAEQEERRENVSSPSPTKKQFVEPAVSVPVDVLESTSFFQAPTVEAAVIS